MNFILISFLATRSALALVDSHREFAAGVPGWTVTAHHMDTGQLRSCSAAGKFGDLEVALGNPSGAKPTEISFRFVKGGVTPGPADPGDYRKGCGAGKGDSPAGSWRYNPDLSSEEYCDGKGWNKPTEANFKKAALLLDGKAIATTAEGAHFKAGAVAGARELFEYGAWFQGIEGLEKRLSKPGKVELSIEGLGSPIALGRLRLERVVAAIERCERR